MSQLKPYIAPLAFLMLVLFLSPTSIKALHHHLPDHVFAIAHTQGASVSAAMADCPVCEFEFVTFIACNIPEYHNYTRFTSFDCCEPTCDLKVNSFTYYSLRAPPVY